MKYVFKNKKGQEITSLETWRQAFISVDKPKHWKKGRSACSLAEFICEHDGETRIESLLNLVGITNPCFTEAEIEHESKFDKCGGSGRMQDLHMLYSSDCGNVLVEIEAKVDETFNLTIDDAYSAAVQYRKEHPTTKRVKRIEDLVERIYQAATLDSVRNLRYQLLYYLAGTCSDAKKYGANVVLMPVLVFKSSDTQFNEAIGQWNKQDYRSFIEKTRFESVTVDGHEFFKREIEDITVYSFYEEIRLK